MATATQNSSSTAITPAGNKDKIVKLMQGESFRKQLGAALMARVPEDYVLRMAMSCINADAKLQVCDPVSVAASILQLAQAGLAPEPWKGHGYLIPRKNKEKQRYECTQLIGYRGYLHLAYRSPKVLKADAKPVYAGDIFDLDLGSGNPPIHKPWIKPESGRETRGEFIGAYAMVKLENGEHLIEWMPKEDIDKIMQRSESFKFGFSPWKSDYVEMARKTPFRRLFKWIPDAELQRIAAMEEAAEFGHTETIMDVETGEIMTVPVAAEETEEIQAPQRKSEAPKAVEPEKPLPTVASAFGPTPAVKKPAPEPEVLPKEQPVPAYADVPECGFDEDGLGSCFLPLGHDGPHEVPSPEPEPRYVKVIDERQRRALFGVISKARPAKKQATEWQDEARKWIRETFKIASTNDLSVDDLPKAIAHFEAVGAGKEK